MRIPFIILLFLPAAMTAQMSFEKSLKKLGLTEDKVIYTSESVIAYPRSFIYDMQNPDSVFYFGCMSSDVKDFKAYFEQPSTQKYPTGHTILRSFTDTDFDTIKCESLNEKMQYFSYKDAAKEFKLTEGVRYFVVCYWSSAAIDKKIIKNYRQFFWYIEKSTLEARVIFVCTDEK